MNALQISDQFDPYLIYDLIGPLSSDLDHSCHMLGRIGTRCGDQSKTTVLFP
jgi:hypothetical protein